MRSRLLLVLSFGVLLLPAWSRAAGPKPIPEPGMALTESDREELQDGADALETKIVALQQDLKNEPFIADIEVLRKAVDWALRYDEFFNKGQVPFARTLLKEGEARAAALAAGKMPWLEASGNVLRGYRSEVDGSVQPYGLVIPPGVKADRTGAHPALVWLLGRDEKRTELAFLQDAKTKPTPLAPPGAIIIRAYGRFCNATKFAGETDVFEVLHAVERQYGIDPNHVGLAGFSMGGASVWHLAVHHSDIWCVASPGAGFAETPIYTKALEPGKPARFPWEVTLWHWYDALACSANLSDLHTIAYSGEIDPQRQSADLMEKAMAAQGLTLERLIGPKTAHKYEPETRKVLESRLEAAIAQGRDPAAASAWLVTYTLRYPDAGWLRADGLKAHWAKAEIKAQVDGAGVATLTTTNVTDLELRRPGITSVVIDGQALPAAPGNRYHEIDGTWSAGPLAGGLRKIPGLTGPVDDAFDHAFLFVQPTGKATNGLVGDWSGNEMDLAVDLWRRTFRGEVQVKKDTGVTDTDLASKNLILWGDPGSNAVLAKIVALLPITWTAHQLVVAGRTYDAARFAPILIFPNPLNPAHYVVINSGIDFRDEAYGTNALQTPKLPDWSVVDLSTPPDGRWPGKIVDAGFFDETWANPRSALAAP